MIPSALPLVLLALAAYRVTRLLGWDTLPPVAAARAWLLRSEWQIPSSNDEDGYFIHGRPLLGDMFECPFCLGFWVSLAFYGAWLALPTAALAVAIPFALSGVVGLLAKNLDG